MKAIYFFAALWASVSFASLLLVRAQAVSASGGAEGKAASAKETAVAAKDPNEPKVNDVSAFMRLKLRHSQQVLEGVALEDFDLIAKNAQQLSLLAQDENWRVYQTLEYRQHSAEFGRIADQLTKAARDKNVDGATLAYMQLTMSCVNCHKYTRSMGQAGQ